MKIQFIFVVNRMLFDHLKPLLSPLYTYKSILNFPIINKCGTQVCLAKYQKWDIRCLTTQTTTTA